MLKCFRFLFIIFLTLFKILTIDNSLNMILNIALEILESHLKFMEGGQWS